MKFLPRNIFHVGGPVLNICGETLCRWINYTAYGWFRVECLWRNNMWMVLCELSEEKTCVCGGGGGGGGGDCSVVRAPDY